MSSGCLQIPAIFALPFASSIHRFISQKPEKSQPKKILKGKKRRQTEKIMWRGCINSVSHLVQIYNNVVTKCCFLPIALFLKLTDNQPCRREDILFQVSAILCGVSSVILVHTPTMLCSLCQLLSNSCPFDVNLALVFPWWWRKAQSQAFMLPPTLSSPLATALNKVLLGRTAGNSNRGIFSASTKPHIP